MRVCMVHQPHFLPWPGYLARCLSVDVFVVLDDVKFNRNHFQQRTKFVNRNGELCWLSLPIERRTRSSQIKDVEIASDFLFKKWQRPIRESYQDAIFFDQVWNGIAETILNRLPNFRDIAENTLEYTLASLSKVSNNSLPEMVQSSTIRTSEDRTQRLADICRDQEITHLVMGEYAMATHQIGELERAGIKLMTQKFIGPESAKPISGVMGIHYMMRYGPEDLAEQLNKHWSLEEI